MNFQSQQNFQSLDQPSYDGYQQGSVQESTQQPQVPNYPRESYGQQLMPRNQSQPPPHRQPPPQLQAQPNRQPEIPLSEWIERNQHISYVLSCCPNRNNQYHRCSGYCLRYRQDPQSKVVIQPLPPINNQES